MLLVQNSLTEGVMWVYGQFKDIPENIKKYLQGLYGISYQEWTKLEAIINSSFDKKKREAERQFSISSKDDIYNPF